MTVSYEDLKGTLEAERRRLMGELEQLENSGGENLGYGTHMADDASAAFDQARDLALRDNLERMLGRIERALNRINNGGYGLCESCGQPIDPARLKALPHASRCLGCQRRLEH